MVETENEAILKKLLLTSWHSTHADFRSVAPEETGSFLGFQSQKI